MNHDELRETGRRAPGMHGPARPSRTLLTILALLGSSLSCADVPSGIRDDPASLTIAVAQGEPYVSISPVRVGGILVACDLALEVASGLPDDLHWTRATLRTRARIGAIDTVARVQLDSSQHAFLRGASSLAPSGRVLIQLGVGAVRPFDWELELAYRVTGRRGEASRLLRGRCGPAVPTSAAAPVIELQEVVGGGAAARAGDTVEVAFRIHAGAGVYEFADGSPTMDFVSPDDRYELRIFATGPQSVDRRRRLVLRPEPGAASWDYTVSALDLLGQSTSATFRIAGSGSLVGAGSPSGASAWGQLQALQRLDPAELD